MRGRRCTQWAMAAAFALAVACPVATGGAATTRTAGVPAKLVGVWHKKLTQAEWDRVGASPPVGVYTVVIKKTGDVIVYLPGGTYDFTTTITTVGARLTLGNVPRCSFKGVYRWSASGRTLILEPTADKSCPIRETFFGGRWKR